MRRALSGLLLALLFALAPTPARASCTCPPLPSVPDAYAAAELVFAETVTGIEGFATSPTGGMRLAMVDLSLTWRGNASTQRPVFAQGWPDGCGYPLQVSEACLFDTGHIDIGVAGPRVCPYVTSCSRTSPLADHPDLARLPPGEQPVPVRRSSRGAPESIDR